MNDGQGVDAVTAQIHKPGSQVWTSPMAMVAGDANAGTYQAIYAAGPNTNAPDAWGNQAAQTYNVRIVGEDVSGLVSSSAFYEFVVEPLIAPPPPPS